MISKEIELFPCWQLSFQNWPLIIQIENFHSATTEIRVTHNVNNWEIILNISLITPLPLRNSQQRDVTDTHAIR